MVSCHAASGVRVSLTAMRGADTLDGVFAVVLDRAVGAPEALTTQVAEVLGVTPYDVRASVVAAVQGPAILSVHAEAEPANTAVAALSPVPVHAIVIDVEAALAHVDEFIAARFSFTATELVVTASDGAVRWLAYADIVTLVRIELRTVTERVEVVPRSLRVGAFSRRSPGTRVVRAAHTDELLFVLERNGAAVRLSEARLTYEGLGDALNPLRSTNFFLVVDELRRRCPDAGFDERLRSPGSLPALLGKVLSPERYVALAAVLVAEGLRGRAMPYRAGG